MRQFISSNAPDKNGLLNISGKDYRYLAQVLRLVAGDMLAVRLQDGSLVNTTVAKIDEKKKQVILQVCAAAPGQEQAFAENQSDYNPKTDLYLFQFVAKGAKMELIVRQAVECGVRAIIPVLGEFSQSGGAEKNFKSERFDRIIKEARQQSGSPVNTEIFDTVPVDKACQLWKEMTDSCGQEKAFSVVLYERNEKTTSLNEAIKPYSEIKKCAVFCGAEGGISPEEIDAFVKAGVHPVHFETNILRCETAALYGIACVQNKLTEL